MNKKEEIFTVGDKTNNGTISKFEIDSNGVRVFFEEKPKNYHVNLNSINHVKTPLFQTFDCVDIFEGDTIYEIFPTFTIYKTKWYNYYGKNGKPLKNKIYFSTKEKAEEYILMNKPVLSLTDVWDNLKVKDQKEVLKFVKSKLNK